MHFILNTLILSIIFKRLLPFSFRDFILFSFSYLLISLTCLNLKIFILLLRLYQRFISKFPLIEFNIFSFIIQNDLKSIQFYDNILILITHIVNYKNLIALL